MVRKVETGDSAVRAAADAFGLSRQTYYTVATALADVVGQRFGIGVRPRSVERVLARREAARSPKSP